MDITQQHQVGLHNAHQLCLI